MDFGLRISEPLSLSQKLCELVETLSATWYELGRISVNFEGSNDAS